MKLVAAIITTTLLCQLALATEETATEFLTLEEITSTETPSEEVVEETTLSNVDTVALENEVLAVETPAPEDTFAEQELGAAESVAIETENVEEESSHLIQEPSALAQLVNKLEVDSSNMMKKLESKEQAIEEDSVNDGLEIVLVSVQSHSL